MKHKFGRKPRIYDPRVPKITKPKGITLPASVNYTSGMPSDLGMALNNSLGDCVEAAACHSVQVWSFNASGGKAMVTPTDAQVEQAYEQWGGYVPGNPNTDNGTVIQVALQDWLKTAFDANVLAGFVEIDVTNWQLVQETIFECGLIFIGMNVPAYIENLESPGSIWDVDPTGDNSSIGGHCVAATGYQKNSNINFITWGSPDYQLTQAFWNANVDEAYALADTDWIAATGATPAGLTLAQLEALMASMQSQPGPANQRRRHRHHRRNKRQAS